MPMLQKVSGAVRALFGNARVEDEMDEELRAYLADAVEDKMRSGMSREDAWRQARVELGSVEAVKDGVRSAGWESFVQTIWQDVRYAGRLLRKDRTFTAIAIFTLALGIGANTAIFGLIDALMLRPLPVRNPEELVQLQMRDPRWGGDLRSTFTNPLWEQVRDQQDVFSHVFASGSDRFNLSQGGVVHMVDGLWVSGDFFNALPVRPAAGRLIGPEDDRRACPAVAVLSHSYWRQHDLAVGGTLSLDNHVFEIIGVTPRGFSGVNVGAKFDVALPICAAAIFDAKRSPSRLDRRSWWWLNVMGRVRPGVTQAQLASRLGVVSPHIMAAALPGDWSAEMQKTFGQMSLVAVPAETGLSHLRSQFDQPLRILMAVVGLVLLIACANIASLMMARANARRKEFALRRALGAGRARLIRQLLTECVLLSSAGALLGLVFARWGTMVLVRYISTLRDAVFLDVSPDGRVLAFTAGVAVLTGILFGVLPAFRSTRVSLTSGMKGGQAAENERRPRVGASTWMVTAQMALSLVLLVAAGLLLRSFAKLTTLNIGFDRSNVMLVQTFLSTANIPADRVPAVDEAIEKRLRGLPGVVSAARSVMTPISGGAWNNNIHTEWSKAVTGDNALTWFNYVSPGYFETLRMPLLAGRGFGERDTKTSPQVAIVNQTLARKFFPNLSPLGRVFRIDNVSGKPGAAIEVVGVIQDAKYESVREDVVPTAFFPAAQVPDHGDAETFELRTVMAPSGLAGAVQGAVASVNPAIPLEIHTLAEQVNDSLVQERMLAMLSGFFGGLALLLAMIGLYGSLSYVVTQRQTEFGVRMALGAPQGSIVRLVMRDVVGVLAGGVVVGLGISLVATRVLQNLLFGLAARDAVTMMASAGVLGAVGLLAGYLPARRAMKVDPMVTLRYE